MVLLIDTNIILDVLLDRKEYIDDSLIIWKLCETNKVSGYISSLTFANLVYIMRKKLNPDKIEELLYKISLIFKISDLVSMDLLRAAEMKWNDYEDALQSTIAYRINADYIITRNIKDFSLSKVKALLPNEIIDLI